MVAWSLNRRGTFVAQEHGVANDETDELEE